MKKTELAEALALAMNLLNNLAKESWTQDQENQLHKLVHSLPESVQSEYWTDGTLRGKDF